MGKYYGMGLLLAAVGTSACGATADEYAASYNGDSMAKITVAGSTQETKETRSFKFSAPKPDTLRADDLIEEDGSCPLDFIMKTDTTFDLVARECTKDNVTLSFKTGSLDVATAGSLTLKFDGEASAKRDDGSTITGTFSGSFTGNK